MPTVLQSKWHSDDSADVQNMTLRLGSAFAEIYKWAVEHNHQLALEVGYHILGLNPALVGIGNLVKEFSYSESLFISSQWQENPVAELLIRFSAAVKNTPRIDNLYGLFAFKGVADF